MAGVDPADPATEPVPLGDLEGELEAGLEGLRVAVCEDLHLVPLADDVADAFERTAGVLRGLGAELVEVGFPDAGRIYETFVTTQRAEALFTHTERGLFPASRDSYGADVLGRLEAATEVTLPEYLAAAAERQRIRAGFAWLFTQADLLLTPVSAGPPLPVGEETTVHLGREIAFRELAMSYTVPQDLAGLPACAVRAGFDALGIPVGMQITGPPWSEARVLRAAETLFRATPEIQARWPTLS
jgi:aspartyl-tRNA(Asn)/glutamyl-tRNA(Gln) amidotransferase subunit A